MDEVEYIVPPENSIPSGVNAPKPVFKGPQKPNKSVNWIKTHKMLSIASMVMAGIVSLVAVVMITGQQVSLFGYQLNPLYNQASIAPICDDIYDPDCEPFPNPNPTPSPNPTPNPGGQSIAPAGFQITVRDNGCSDQERTSFPINAGSSGSVTDTNAKDPDCARITFNAGNVSSVAQNESIYSNDFRIGTRVGESENNCTSQIDSSIRWTPWASDGGGTSPQAVGTASSNDPDCIWLHFETRPMPAGKGIRDARIGIASGGSTQFTPWARSGGGNSGFSIGGNVRPTTLTLDAQTITASIPPVTPPVTPPNPPPEQEPPQPDENPNSLLITGSFPAGTVGQSYTTTVRTDGQPVLSCSWTLVSIEPAVNGATVQASSTPTQGVNALADFRGTPTTAGLYKVTISANCGNAGTAQRTFDWVVGKEGTGGGSSNTCLDQASLGKLSAIYRFWSPAYGDHLYTTNPNEKPAGYRFEGVSGYVFAEQMSNTVPIYRSAQRQIGSHYYTTANDDPTQYGYVDEGILGYAYANSVTGSAPWYRMHKGGETSDYVHTISETEKTAIKELGYGEDGVVAHICGGDQATELQPLFRLWGNNDGDHFYTTNFSERDNLLTRNYLSEGITGYIYGVRKDGSVPLHRSYNRTAGDHLYSASESEARSGGYVYEGVVGYISPTDTEKTTPIYRLYNAAIGDHFYTASSSEAAAAIANGYKGEGITGYLYLSQ